MALPGRSGWRQFKLRDERERRPIPLACLLAGLLFAPAIGNAETSAQPSGKEHTEICTLSPGPSRMVARVADAATLVLDDGSEVHLIGALTPRAQDSGAAAGTWPLEKKAISLVSELVLGQRVQLAYGATRRDRYGRQLAHVFVGSGKNRIWLQGTLLTEGLARAYAWPNDGTCLAELLAHENVARDQRLGLWSLPEFRPVPAEFTRRLLKRRSTLQIVQGRILEVSRVRNAIYLNFGPNWHRDFSVRIPVGVARGHPQWDLSLDSLKGRKVEVRGWIERSNGPLIEISQPSEIVILDSNSRDDPQAQAPPLAERGGEKESGASPEHGDQVPEHDTPPDHDKKEKRPKPTAPGALNL